MSFPLRIPDQLKQHLRALRKSRGLTQSSAWRLWLASSRPRIAEIEANPGAVSLDQLTKVLAALGGTLHLHSAEVAGTESRVVPDCRAEGTAVRAKVVAKRAPKSRWPARRRQSHTHRATKPAPRTGIVIPPKKGTW